MTSLEQNGRNPVFNNSRVSLALCTVDLYAFQRPSMLWVLHFPPDKLSFLDVAQSFTLVVDNTTIERLSGVLIFEVRGKLAERKTKTAVKKQHNAKPKNGEQIRKEVEENEKLLQQIERALSREGTTIQELIGNL